MSESYARKLRQFMQERAQERLASQRRVSQLEEVLSQYSAGKKPTNFGSPLGGTSAAATAAAAARDAALDAARSGAFGTPPARADPSANGALGSAGGDYTRRLEQLAAERAQEEARSAAAEPRTAGRSRTWPRVLGRVRAAAHARDRSSSGGPG